MFNRRHVLRSWWHGKYLHLCIMLSVRFVDLNKYAASDIAYGLVDFVAASTLCWPNFGLIWVDHLRRVERRSVLLCDDWQSPTEPSPIFWVCHQQFWDNTDCWNNALSHSWPSIVNALSPMGQLLANNDPCWLSMSCTVPNQIEIHHLVWLFIYLN